MAFTGILGTSYSMLGSFELGVALVGGSSSPDFDQDVPQDVVLSQTLTVEKTVVRSVDHTLTLTQLALSVIDQHPSSTLTLTDAATFEKFKNLSANNSLALTHANVVALTLNRTLNQGLSLTQAASRKIYKALSISNTLGVNHTTSAIVTRSASNTLILSQLAEVLMGKIAKNVLSIGQTLEKEVDFSRHLNDNFIPFQVLTRNLTSRHTVSNTLSMSQTFIGYVVKSAQNVLSFSQTVSGITTKPAFNVFAGDDSVQLTRSAGRKVEHLVPIIDTLFVAKGKSITVSQAFGMNQFTRGTRRLTVTAQNALSLAHALVREYKYGSVIQAIDLDNELIVSKLAPRSITNTLLLTQTVSVSKTIVRSLVNTLTFHKTFEKYVGIGGHEIVAIPDVQVVKVKKLVVLQSDSLVITLPSPEFNDSEGGTGRINIKRTMAGGRRVYTRDNVTSKLNYTFIIDRKKAIELRNFIMNSNTKFLHMENWKGELWAVQMTNSPFSFGEDAAWLGSPGGNKSSITLEFEGVKLN